MIGSGKEREDTRGEIDFRREPLPPLSVIETEWRTLEATANPSFFTSWHWIGTLLTALPEANRPEILRGFAQGRTVALALLGSATRRRRRGLIRSRAFYLNETGDPRFDAVTMEHNSILASRDCKADVFNALTAWFARQGGQADELHFAGSLLQWPHDAVECNGLSRTEIVVPSYSVDLSQLEDSAGELYQVLSANARQQLRRAIRRFEEFGPPCIREAATEIEALEFFTEMKALHSESWQRRGKSHAFTSPFFEAFHRLLINRTFADGGTQMLRASAGDRVLGYLYNFRLGQRVYAYQSGFADGNQRERPGMVTHALAIQHAFHSGARVYDFMAGRNRLKESFSTRCEPMLWQVLQQPRLAFRLENLGRRLRHLIGADRSE